MRRLVSPSIVGREAELEYLEDALAAARDGSGRVVILSGEAGIGKSRLTLEVTKRAREAGVRVVAGRAVETGTPIPYRPFAEALQSGLRTATEIEAALLEPYRSALRRLLPDVEHGLRSGEDVSPLVLMEGLLTLFAVIGRDAGLLLVLEDLHWADADTLAVVEYLADHLESVPALCVCTERTDSHGVAAELIGSLAARRAVDRMVLTPLSDEEVVLMARLILGDEDVPAGVVQALGARAAGVPFLVEETLAAYLAAGGPVERAPEWWVSRQIAASLPPSYRQLVAERLAALDDDAQRVVTAAAVIGRGFDWRLLASIASLDEGVVLAKLRAATAAGLISAQGAHVAMVFEFRHALAREAVLAETFDPERAELSLRAARAIEAAYPGLPGDWCQRAADLYEQGGEPLRACGLLSEAAQRAVARSAFRTAEGILAHARDLAEGDWMAWMRIDDLLLDVSAKAGKTEQILKLGYGLIDVYQGRYRGGVDASRMADLHLRIARGIAPAGDWGMVSAELDEARRFAEQSGDEALMARIAALDAQAALAFGDVERAAALASTAVHTADRLELGDVLCEALLVQGQAASREGESHRAVALFSRCERTADLRRLPLWRIRALLELGVMDNLSKAEVGRLAEARLLAGQIGAVSTLAAIELELAWAHLGRAELVPAAEAIARCLDVSRVHRLSLLPSALAATCMLHALGDDDERLERAVAEALELDPDEIAEARVIGNGRVVLSLARGDEAGAFELLEPVMPRAERATDWTVSWLWGLGTFLHAVESTKAQLRDAQHTNPVVAGYLGYARAVTLGRAEKHEAAHAAMTEADATMAPGWRRAHARLLVARCAFEGGWGDPTAWMRESLAFLDSAPLPQFAGASKSALRRAGAPVPRRGRGESAVPADLLARGVTSREMDVLQLVGERFSNTDIGRRLYLSPRTVEGHVASLRRKLALNSRRELIDLAHRHRGADSKPGASAP